MAISSNSALSLLSAYDSSNDESDEDIPGPRVSVKRVLSSRESSDSSSKRQATGDQKKRLPPPSDLLQLFNAKNSRDDTSDTPEEHNGRIRSFPHERGNWASYVFIAVDRSASLESFIDVVCTTCDQSLKLQKSIDLHISLTRTVILKHHWIDPISSSVQQLAQSMLRFSVCLGEIKVYTNEEKTRTFIGVVITAGQETLTRIARRLDEILEDFKLPPFYEEASFHLSIASCVGNRAAELETELPRLQTTLEMFIHSTPLQWSVCVEKLLFRTGNKYFTFNLLI